MKAIVPAAVLLISALLAIGFVRALPAAVERERVGRDNLVKAICEPALHPEPVSPALGPLPVPAPDFSLKDYAGRDVSLASLKGRVVLLNFWATWCPTCVVEMPSLEKLALSEKKKPLTLLAVSVDQEWNVVRQFFSHGTEMSVVLDKEKSVPARYGTEKFPETFIIDKEGRARYYVVSDRDWSTSEVKACFDALIDS